MQFVQRNREMSSPLPATGILDRQVIKYQHYHPADNALPKRTLETAVHVISPL
jgi:hypothetical protein